MTQPSYIPEGFPAVVPFLVVEEPDRVIDFLQATFETEILQRSDGHGKLYVALKVEGSVIELSQSSEAWKSRQAALHVYVEDVDATYRKAIEAGATSLFEPADMEYGERGAGISDLAGIHWYLATYVGCSSET